MSWRRSARDDDADEAAARVAVSAVRVEAIGVATRAAGDVFDLQAFPELRSDRGA
jgi:hypothetical protein